MPKSKKADKRKSARPDAPMLDMPVIDPKLISALVCPKTRGHITYDRVKNEMVSKKAKLAYPIREGVPIMLIEEARQLD